MLSPLRIVFLAWLVTGVTLSATAANDHVEQWGTFEIALPGPGDGNAFVDVRLSATFTDGITKMDVAGFYDGDGTYRVRFMPERAGTWHYETHSNRWMLTGKTGAFVVTPATPSNHGPVRVFRTFHFAYADGTPYRPVGTTTYNWFYQPDKTQEETLKTLASSPFNKVRMLILPSSGVPPPPQTLFPFVGTPPRQWDMACFDPAFFRRIEKRIGELRELGIEADLILFHPYGQRWGFDTMGTDNEDRYVRYVVARLAAFRNVWWSLANEYDFLRPKRESDWDHLFQLVQSSDPYGHLRSIHNGARLYDNSKPWVTHASIQNGAAVEDSRAAELYRDVWNKPVVYDEVKYEGTSARRWGNLSGQELVHRFWAGTVAGTYVGHGETLKNPSGTSWLSGGGSLVGESPARIAFLKRILDDSPPEGIDPADKWQDPTIGGKPGEYYLVYFGREAPSSWLFHLPKSGVIAGQSYRVEVIDTWAMTITPVDGAFTAKRRDNYTFDDAGGRSITLPGKPYMALRIRRIGGPAAPREEEKEVEP